MLNTQPLIQESVAEPIKAGYLARHRHVHGVLVVVVSICASFMLINGLLYVAQIGRVPMFTQINGVNVGFKTIADAKAELSRQHELKRLQVTVGAKTYAFSAPASGVNIDADKSVEQAMVQQGWLRVPIVNLIANTTVQFGTYYSVDNPKLEESLKAYVSEHNVPAVDAKLVVPASPDQEVSIVPEKQGSSLGVSDVANDIVTAVADNNFDVEVTPNVEMPKVKAEDLKPLVAQARAIAKTSSNGLYNLVETFAKTHGGLYKVAAVEIGGDNRSAFYQADDAIVTASTYKVFVAYIALQKIEQGKLKMDSPTSMGTVDYCMQRMILVSDNACAVAVGDKIGWREMHNIARAEGFSRTSLISSNGHLYSTARDEVKLLYKLQNGNLINADHTKYLFDLMKRQVYRTGIPAGSSGAIVADKVGFLGAYNHDMGIVYGSKATYALTILTSGSSFANIKLLTSQINDFYNQ